ncbi:MAG: fused MFS/spermidine synthase [Alphaproteobacteria bacterium]|nr:fused MFS/spermidine synthase [Alphaproteobacteria bacterium]
MTRALAAATVTLGALLLFLVQPIVGRLLLPRFGGGAAIWSACLVFFQVALLLGYAYAAFITARISWRKQRWLHVALIAASLGSLPLGLGGGISADGHTDPALGILISLALGIGPTYGLLASTSPLVQGWLARAGAAPWRLFALSNVASLAALIAYPFLIEPYLGLHVQTWVWSGAYAVYAVLIVGFTWRIKRADDIEPAPAAPDEDMGIDVRPTPLWMIVVLAAVPSALLVAVTEFLTRDVAPVPMLWIPPLAVYLLTFVAWFDGRLGYVRPMWLLAAAMAATAMAWTLIADPFGFKLKPNLLMFVGGLFMICLFCHGEVSARRPAPEKLGSYYLAMAAGGALGGLAIGLLAPVVLHDQYDLGIVLALVAGPMALAVPRLESGIVAWWRTWRGRPIGSAASIETTVARVLASALILPVLGSGALAIWDRYESDRARTVSVQRNFYGVLRVTETNKDTDDYSRSLVHGAILHGFQMMALGRQLQATGYYRDESGVGRVLRSLPAAPRRIGVVGLGSGVMAAHGRAGDVVRFYDIDPVVPIVARRDFTFVTRTPAVVDIVPGDARISLAREEPQQYSVLVIDAFSGDAIPIHLLTIEAIDIYMKHVIRDGALLVHVSNKFFDLAPLVKNAAEKRGLYSALARDLDTTGFIVSDWVVVTRDPALIDAPILKSIVVPITDHPEWGVWTDDRASILPLIKW